MDTQNVIEPLIGDGKLCKPCPHGGMTYASFMTEVITQSHKRPYQVMLVSQDETMCWLESYEFYPNTITCKQDTSDGNSNLVINSHFNY